MCRSSITIPRDGGLQATEEEICDASGEEISDPGDNSRRRRQDLNDPPHVRDAGRAKMFPTGLFSWM